MTTWVAFVRAVMIGREGLDRTVLLDMFGRAGASDAVSYISTGNVSFRCSDDALGDVVEHVERELHELLARPTPVFVRTEEELRSLVGANPFAEEPDWDIVAREVSLFAGRVPDHLVVPIRSPRGDWEVFAATDREVFSVQRLVDGRTQSPGGRVERLAREPITTRAVGTIERILEKLAG
jgi:uncharacterized protein (DUF1697 family)